MLSAISSRGGPVFMAFGLTLLIFGIRNGFDAHSFTSTAMRVQGTVETLNAGGSHPQIRFLAPNNLEISYPQGGLVFGYRPGERVEVLFDAADPANTATVDAVGAVWFTTLVLCALGMAFLASGTIIWLLSRS